MVSVPVQFPAGEVKVVFYAFETSARQFSHDDGHTPKGNKRQLNKEVNHKNVTGTVYSHQCTERRFVILCRTALQCRKSMLTCLPTYSNISKVSGNMTCPRMLKSSVLEQIDSLPHLKRGTLPLRSVWSLRDDKRETVLRPGLLAQLAERGADNAKVVSSSLTWTKIGENVVFFSNQFYLHSRSFLLWQSFDSGDAWH